MLKIYGRSDCPDCANCKASLDAKGIEYDFRDIKESLHEFHVFMKIRDTESIFDDIKGTGGIGIPCLVTEDRTIVLDWESYIQNIE